MYEGLHINRIDTRTTYFYTHKPRSGLTINTNIQLFKITIF